MNNYLASAVVIFNLTSMQTVQTILMELTKVSDSGRWTSSSGKMHGFCVVITG